MLEICSNWVIGGFAKSFHKRKHIFSKGVGYLFPKLPQIFWLFSTPQGGHQQGHDIYCHQANGQRLATA